jgi:hypothetical protein
MARPLLEDAMKAIRTLVLTLAAVGLASIAAPALAAVPKGDCLWQAIPAAQRNAMLDNYRAKGLASLQEVEVNDALTLTLRRACNFTEAEDFTAGEIVGAVLIEKGADLVLAERNSIAKGSLDKRWKALAQAERDAMTTFGLAIMKNENTGAAEALAVVNKVTTDLGLPTNPLNTDVFAYLAGRAIREAREAGIK